MKNSLKVAVFAVAAAVVPAAHGQYTGVSHPEQVPVTTSPESSQRSAVLQANAPTNETITAAPGYVPTPSASGTTLKVRPADGMVVTEASSAPVNVASVRDERASAGSATVGDPDGMIVTEVAAAPNELPAGTMIKVRLLEGFSTESSTAGMPFHGELTEPVERNGRVLLPAGTQLTGRLVDVHGGKRISGAASLYLQPMEVVMPDGVRYKIAAQVADTDLYRRAKVDNEGAIVRKDHAGETLATMGLVTGAGIATGAVVAGVPGAVVGGLIGAGVGTTVWLKQDRQMTIPPGTKVVFSLNRSLFVGSE